MKFSYRGDAGLLPVAMPLAKEFVERFPDNHYEDIYKARRKGVIMQTFSHFFYVYGNVNNVKIIQEGN